MSQREVLEERLAAVESAVAELQRAKPAAEDAKGIDAFRGTFRDEPAFDEVIRLGQEQRGEDRTE